MLRISEKANRNYLAKVVSLGKPITHPNADRLQGFIIDHARIYTDLSFKEHDICIYFPLECQIDTRIISYLNLYSDKSLNRDITKGGFFNAKGRVRAVRLRSEPSQGFLLKAQEFVDAVATFAASTQGFVPIFDKLIDVDSIGFEFDSVGNETIIKKYVIQDQRKGGIKSDKKLAKKVSRVVENQFRFHIDTEHLRKNIYKVDRNDYVSITAKFHGTSVIFGKLLTYRKLSFIEKILKKLGVNINDKVYDLLYSSRRVIKNDDLNTQANHYYSSDVWGDAAKTFEYAVQKGYTLYGEIVGYTRDGAFIQKGYDYGCIKPVYENEYVEDVHYRVYVYRITFTNEDGYVSELSWRQIKEYCEHFGINHVPEYYFGKLVDFDKSFKKIKSDDELNEAVIKLLEEKYLEKYCEFCGNRVPSEGIVLRIDKLFKFDAYKLKSFAFMELESKQLDDNIIDIESEEQ
jgi:hypothetical protein